jgi:hypothetical protein
MYAHNNAGTIGSHIFYAVCTEAVKKFNREAKS